MSAYTVSIRDSDDLRCNVEDGPQALNTARAIAIAVAKIRVGEVVEVRSGNRLRLAFKGHEVRAVEVRRA